MQPHGIHSCVIFGTTFWCFILYFVNLSVFIRGMVFVYDHLISSYLSLWILNLIAEIPFHNVFPSVFSSSKLRQTLFVI